MSIPPSQAQQDTTEKEKVQNFFRVIFDLASQFLKSPAARFLLYTTCIVKRASATGKYGYNRRQPVKTGCCSQIATNARRRANKLVGRLSLLSSTNRSEGDTRRSRAFLLTVSFPTIISFYWWAKPQPSKISQNGLSLTNCDKLPTPCERF